MAGRSSRLAEDGVRTGSGARSRGEESRLVESMISGGKVQLKEKQNRRKRGAKRCLCVNKGKPWLNNAMAA